MIPGFRDRRSRDFAAGERVRAFDGIARKATMKLDQLDAAVSLDDLAALPGNRLEALEGDRKGQFSAQPGARCAPLSFTTQECILKLQHQWIPAILPLTAALFSLSAHAPSPDDDRGFYIGGGVGEFKVEIDDVDDLTSTIDRYDADDTAYKLFVGYRFASYLALEGAHINLGSPSADILPGVRAETEVDGFAPYLVATLPIEPIEIFARAGYFFYDAEASVRSSLGGVTASDDGEEFTYGGGVGITAFERVNLRLEYDVFDVEDTDDTNALWLTAAWRF